MSATCRCGKRWSGSRTAHCGKCHETFSTVATFDRHHRKGLDGLVFNERRGVWAMPNDNAFDFASLSAASSPSTSGETP